MSDRSNENEKKKRGESMGTGVALGLLLGVIAWQLVGNVALLSLGLLLGVMVGSLWPVRA